jgi:hypothetical protein
MKSIWLNLVRTSLLAGLSLFAALNAFGQENAPGIVRISSPSASQVQANQVQQAGFRHGSCPPGGSYSGNGDCDFCNSGSGCRTGWRFGRCGSCSCCNKQDIANYFMCKFGYFVPTGAGGAGVPICGKYSRVYPQDPHYFDQRDGQVWAAQGYGAPIAVPLAPVVGHTYNYGWGTPSSRLTPVSHPAY